ncbi:MAG: hypothetical protein ACP5N7_01990 [Candidatus Pacearchaeota archaeon]
MLNEFTGDNLNRYQNAQIIEGESSKDLLEKLKMIRADFSIIQIVALNSSTWFAFINFNKIIKGDLNETINQKRKYNKRINKDGSN